jgi:hypothetical protein
VTLVELSMLASCVLAGFGLACLFGDEPGPGAALLGTAVTLFIAAATVIPRVPL